MRLLLIMTAAIQSSVFSLCSVKRPWNPISHLSVAKLIWKEVLRPGDSVIDATCGNGHDSLTLGEIVLTENSGRVHCVDIQESAVQATELYLRKHLSPEQFRRVTFHHQCHSILPDSNPVSLICYNLGYLPGKPRSAAEPILMTLPETTLKSLTTATNLIKVGGILSVTAYPGHLGGEQETEVVQRFFKELSLSNWSVHQYTSIGHPTSPILYVGYRIR